MATSKKPASKGKPSANGWAGATKGLDKAWKKNREATGQQGTDVPDGTYPCRLMKAVMGAYDAKPATADKKAMPAVPYVNINWVVADGEYVGDTLFHALRLKGVTDEVTRIGQEQFAQTCKKLDLDPPDTIEDEEAMKEVVEELNANKPYALLKAKHNSGGYINFSVQRLLNDEEIEEVEDNLTADEEEGDEPEEEEDEVEEESEEEEEDDAPTDEDEDEDDDEDEEEDEDEKPAPRPGKKPVSKTPAKKPAAGKKPARK